MQPNYEEMMKKQQQDYQRSRDPFQYGQQVAQRRYSEIMSDIDARRQATQESYGDLYAQARQRAVRGAAGSSMTMSGGMGQQQRDFVSAIEMQELGRIGNSRNQAVRDLYTQGQAAFSNAQLEGQQATQMEAQNRQTQLQLVQQRQAILDSDLPDAQKQAQLAALEGTAQGGMGTEIQPEPYTFAKALTITGSVGIGAGVAAKTLTAVGASAKGVAGLIAKQGVIVKTAAGAGGALSKTLAASAFAGKTGVAALWQGAKIALMKTGLAKGTLTAVAGVGKAAATKGALALTGLGPVGWGILAVLGTAAAVYGVVKLTESAQNR